MTLKKMFPAGQLPDKFKKTSGATMQKLADQTTAEGLKHFARHERNTATLLRFVETMVTPEEATPFQVATVRAAMAAHGTCPDCGGSVHVDTEAEVLTQDGNERETSRRPAPVAFCSGCEFAMEMPKEEDR